LHGKKTFDTGNKRLYHFLHHLMESTDVKNSFAESVVSFQFRQMLFFR